jgi:hypothetical protein
MQEELRWLQQTERMIEARGVSDEGIYKVPQAYAVLGDKAALCVLQKSVEGGFFCSPYFMKDPSLDSLPQKPAFSNLMQQAETRHEQFKIRFFRTQRTSANRPAAWNRSGGSSQHPIFAIVI